MNEQTIEILLSNCEGEDQAVESIQDVIIDIFTKIEDKR